jgi:hypothetical protein
MAQMLGPVRDLLGRDALGVLVPEEGDEAVHLLPEVPGCFGWSALKQVVGLP